MNEAQREVMHQAEEAGPAVGMGITVQVGSDSYAGTIIEVSESGYSFKFQKDKRVATKSSNRYGAQSYLYVPNPEAEIEKAIRRKDGKYYQKYGPRHYSRVYLGVRDAYDDPHF